VIVDIIIKDRGKFNPRQKKSGKGSTAKDCGV